MEAHSNLPVRLGHQCHAYYPRVFTTSYKQSAWDYGSYYCGPIVRFYGSSGYAFHSRLQYWPMNSDRYYDARIGFPISHGCLRMYNEDIWWMYNNIPNGTTVVVY